MSAPVVALIDPSGRHVSWQVRRLGDGSLVCADCGHALTRVPEGDDDAAFVHDFPFVCDHGVANTADVTCVACLRGQRDDPRWVGR